MSADKDNVPPTTKAAAIDIGEFVKVWMEADKSSVYLYISDAWCDSDAVGMSRDTYETFRRFADNVFGIVS